MAPLRFPVLNLSRSSALAVALAIATLGIGLAQAAPAPTVAASTGQSVLVRAKGMVCDFCMVGLEKGFKKNPAVDPASVRLNKDTQEVRFNVPAGRELSDGEIEAIVTKGGLNLNNDGGKPAIERTAMQGTKPESAPAVRAPKPL